MEYRAESKVLGMRADLDVSRPRSTSLAQAFDPRRNSLNFLRLALAVTVVVGHAIGLGGFGNDLILGKTTLGTIAVYGFFGISGFLIASSASRNHLGRYLWQRFLRIFPGFWVCLLVTVTVFGLIGWSQSVHPGCGIGCYVRPPDGPLQYLFHNGLLKITQQDIAHGPSGVPLPWGWNGSLWTLFYEFLCYFLLGGLAVVGLLRRRRAVLGLTVVLWVLEIVVVCNPTLSWFAFQHTDMMYMLTFAPVFLTGASLYAYRDMVPDSGVLALICGLAFSLGFLVPLGASGGFQLTSADMLAPALAYPVLWLGTHLPFQRAGARNDYSYDVYIYALLGQRRSR